MKDNKIPVYLGIQYLRGFAALMVVAFHLEHQLRQMAYDGPWLHGLAGGVDIFFVISGFIMWVTTASRVTTSLSFWWHRLVRIVPLYWLLTSIVVAVMLVRPQALQTTRFDTMHIFASYIFVPYLNPTTHSVEPVVVPGWTLNYEMLFYLVFGLALFLPNRLRFIAISLTLVGIVITGRLLDPPSGSVASFVTSEIILEFVFGMAVGATLGVGGYSSRVSATTGAVLVVGGIILTMVLPDLLQRDLPRSLSVGVAASAVVAGTLVLEHHRRMLRSALLRVMGDASYSIYLSHVLTLSIVSQGWRKLELHVMPGGLVVFCVFAFIAASLVGVFSYYAMERPFRSLVRKKTRAFMEAAT